MKRTIFRISLLMLLGVVTSIAVAWGCAWRFERLAGSLFFLPGGWRSHVVVGDDVFLIDSDSILGFDRVDGWWPADTKLVALGSEGRPYWYPGTAAGRVYAVGLPVRCLSGRSMDYEVGTRNLLEVSGVTLPYGPILPGLLANTAIYGGMWFAILFGPGVFIRWRRRRAGRCAKCGYDLRGLSPDSECPECGAREL